MLNSIVIVDDDDDFLQIVGTMVKVQFPSATVYLARDGSEALAIITNETPPEVVITDIAMPRLDGNALCRAVQERYGDRVKLIAMTGRRFSAEAGFHTILTKPFTIDDLIAAIDGFYS